MPEKQHTPDESLQQEFNRWAEAGEGEKMENHHLNITEKTLRHMNLRPGERVLDLGCGSGAAAYYLASRCSTIEIVCVTNSSVQAEICRRKFAKLGKRAQVIVADFDSLVLDDESFDAIYSLESIGYTKDLDAWLRRCWAMLKPGGRLVLPLGPADDQQLTVIDKDAVGQTRTRDLIPVRFSLLETVI